MSIQPSTENRKQPPSVYTVMLLLSMLFMLIAVITMYIELRRWGPEYFDIKAARPNVMVVSDSDPIFS